MFKYKNSKVLCPTELNKIVDYLSFVIDNKPVQKNIAYTLQYMEYLDHLIGAGNVTSVLFTQLYKTFIVSEVSVIEAFLYCLLKKNSEVKLEEWKKVGETKRFSMTNNSTQLEVSVLEKIENPTFKELKFETIINKASKIGLLGKGADIYVALKKIQKLRNKIHIYNVENLSHSDYHSFNQENYFLAKNILYKVFYSVNKSGLEDVLGFCIPQP